MAKQETKEGKAKSLANLDKGMWKKGESGNPAGRPRRALRLLEDKIGIEFNASLTKEDKYSIIEAMLEMNITQLKGIATDPSTPAFMAVVASAIKTDIAKGRLGSLDQLFDRFFGKPDQLSRMHIAGEDGAPLITSVVIKGRE